MTQQRPAHRRLAFTTVELLVSTVLMVIAMIGVMGIFNISSGAAARTNAHAEMLEASASLQGELSHHLSQIAPGLLIIESPPPTTVRSDVPGGPPVRRLRHDRLVFISSGSPEEFQSSIDPRRGRPDDPLGALDPQLRPAATSREALLYFGHGIPVTFDALGAPIERNIDGPSTDLTLTASEWMFMHREILLLTDSGAPGWTPTPPNMTVFTALGAMLDGAPLDDVFRESRMDAVLSAIAPVEAANAATLVDLIDTRSIADLSGGDYYATPSRIHALWQPNWAILTPRVNLPAAPLNPPDPFPPDYYTRAGSTFIPRLSDFRIEWTDGKRIDPLGVDGLPNTIDDDHRTRWFGLAPDSPSTIDPSDSASIDSMHYRARMRSIADIDNPSNPNLVNPDNASDETAAFAGIEWSPFGINDNQNAQYRAVWRSNNWNFRPKALRFTYRLYDAGSRLQQTATIDLNENGEADPDLSTPKPAVKQQGLVFSIVVPIP